MRMVPRSTAPGSVCAGTRPSVPQDCRGELMKRIVSLVIGAAAMAGVVAHNAPASGQGGGEAAPGYGIRVPAGYREWRVISVAQVGPPINDIRVKLGNDIAVTASRAGTLPFPDGAIIARLAYKQVASEENNKVFRAAAEQQGLPAEQIEKLLAASSVAGPATNVQCMVKDSKKYAATGGWRVAHFTNGQA